jgi:hypothetical protein
MTGWVGLADLRADYDRQAGRSLAMPIAGALVWTAVGAAGLVMPDRQATIVLLFATGAIFPVATLLARRLGERLLGNTNPLARLMVLSTLMVNLLWVVHLSALAVAPELVPLTVGIGLGLHWIVFSWLVGQPVGIAHALLRSALVGAVWWLVPDARVAAVSAAVVVAYVASIATLSRRVPNGTVVADPLGALAHGTVR